MSGLHGCTQMRSHIVSRFLSPDQKRKLKAIGHTLKSTYVRRFRSYDYSALLASLEEIGVDRDGVLMVHSSYSAYNGFKGPPTRVVLALQEAIGAGGTLVMPSSPYTTSTKEYVKSGKVFDVRRTASRMGIVSEIFRRQRDTVRSLNPAHPVLASGPVASWLVAGHERCAHSCGPGSPFDKLVEKDAKVLFFDAQLTHLMFFHYLEHAVNDELPFPLYDSQPHEVPVIDKDGKRRAVAVYPFSSEVMARRHFPVLEAELRKQSMVREQRVGNTTLTLVRVRDTLEATRTMAGRKEYFYNLSGCD